MKNTIKKLMAILAFGFAGTALAGTVDVSTYAKLKEAIQDTSVDVINVTDDIDVPCESDGMTTTAALSVSGSRNLLIQGKDAHVYTIKRTGTTSNADHLSILEIYGTGTYDGMSVSLKNIVFDGGAIWKSGSTPETRWNGRGTKYGSAHYGKSDKNDGLAGRSVIDIANKGTLNLESGAVVQNGDCTNNAKTQDTLSTDHKTHCYGGGIRIECNYSIGGGTVNVKSGAVVQDCVGSGNGGGVGAYNLARINIYGGTVRRCSSLQGGGICVTYAGADGWGKSTGSGTNSGVASISGGVIEDCWASDNGGGIIIDGVATDCSPDDYYKYSRILSLTVKDCTAAKTGDEAKGGSAIFYDDGSSYLARHPAVTVSNCNADGNFTELDYTADSSIYRDSEYTVNELTTTRHTVTFVDGADQYGQIKVEQGRSAGAMFPADPARTGMVFTEWRTNLLESTSKIDKDTVINSDVTAYAYWVSVKVSFDSATVPNTTYQVFLKDSPITPDSTGKYYVPSNEQNIVVVYTANSGYYFADGATAKTNSIITSTDPATVQAPLPSAPTQHKHCICGTGTCAVGGHTHDDPARIWTAWTATDSLPTTADNWYLSNDVTLTAEYKPVNGVNLCLNGHTVKQTTDGSRVISVVSTSSMADHTFALTDCVQTGKITGGAVTEANNYGGGVNVATNSSAASGKAVFKFYGGIICGNTSTGVTGKGSGCGGGACVNSGCEFYMYGGVISNNTATSAADNYKGTGRGGGLFVSGTGNAFIYGGDICYNTVNRYGGGIEVGSGGSSVKPKLTFGGTARVFGNTGGCAGGICADTGSQLTIIGGEIFDNEANGGILTNGDKGKGGGLYLYEGPHTISNCVIRNNRASVHGGGICHEATAAVTIGGTLVVTNNTVGGVLENAWLATGETFVLSSLASDSKIGVTLASAPAKGAKTAFTTNGSTSDLTKFTSDDAKYNVVYDTDHLALEYPDIVYVEVQEPSPLPDHVDSFKVYANGVEVVKTGGKYMVVSNSTNVSVVYVASSDYYFSDGSTALTNTLTAAQTGTNPATLPAAPAAPVLGVVKVTTASSTIYYETLAPAFASIGAGGTGTVTMMRDLTLAETGAAWVPDGSDITFDLNGKKIDWTTSKGDSLIYFDEGTDGNLTIKDSSTGGTIISTCTSTEVTNSAIVVYCKGDGDLTVEGGTFVCSNQVGAATLFFKDGNGDWAFSNGTYRAVSEGTRGADFLYCLAATGTTVIAGGDFDITAKGAAASGVSANGACKETIVISGGDFDIDSAGTWYGAFTAGNGTLIAKDGDFNVVSTGAGVSCFTAERNGTTIISNGTFYAESKGAYAYAASACATGNLVIAGGTLSAKAALETCATVIGKNASTVTIVQNPTIILPTGSEWDLSVQTIGGYLDFTGYTGANFDRFAVDKDGVFGDSYVKGDFAKVANGVIFDGFFSTRPENGWVQNGKYPLHNTNAATRVAYPWTVGLVVNYTPPTVPNTTATVCTNGVPMEAADPYILPTNVTDVTVIYTANPGYTFPDGTTAKTNDVDTTVNPATTKGTLPTAPVVFVEVKEPNPPMTNTTFKVFTNGVEVAKTGDKWLVISNTAPVEVVYTADPDWYFTNRVSAITNTVDATKDPVIDANQPVAPEQYVQIVPEEVTNTTYKVYWGDKEITPPPYYVPSNAAPVRIVYETKPGYTFPDGSTVKTNELEKTATGNDPASPLPTKPIAPVVFVEVQEPDPVMTNTTFKVLTNGVEVTKINDKWLVVSNTAPVEVVYQADADWYFTNRVAAITNTVDATVDPVKDANQPKSPEQYVQIIPEVVDNTTVKVYWGDKEITPPPYYVPSNAAPVKIVYETKPGYTFPDGSTVKTNELEEAATHNDPASPLPAKPAGAVMFVEVQEPNPPMTNTTFKVFTNGVAVAKTGDKWLVVSNTAPVEVVYIADPDWYYTNRVAAITNTVDATVDPVVDANQPKSPEQYVQIIPEVVDNTTVKVYWGDKEITPPPYYVPSNAAPVRIVYKAEPGYYFPDGTTVKTNELEKTATGKDPAGPLPAKPASPVHHEHGGVVFTRAIGSIAELEALCASGGTGYLTADLEVPQGVVITVNADVKICLDGHAFISGNDAGSSFTGANTLSYYDCTNGVSQLVTGNICWPGFRIEGPATFTDEADPAILSTTNGYAAFDNGNSTWTAALAWPVAFDPNDSGLPGGQPLPVVTNYVKRGEAIAKPSPDPVKADKAFDGWYTNAACTADAAWDFATPVTGGLALYAKWAEPGALVENGDGVLVPAKDFASAVTNAQEGGYVVSTNEAPTMVIDKELVVATDDVGNFANVTADPTEDLVKTNSVGSPISIVVIGKRVDGMVTVIRDRKADVKEEATPAGVEEDDWSVLTNLASSVQQSGICEALTEAAKANFVKRATEAVVEPEAVVVTVNLNVTPVDVKKQGAAYVKYTYDAKPVAKIVVVKDGVMTTVAESVELKAGSDLVKGVWFQVQLPSVGMNPVSVMHKLSDGSFREYVKGDGACPTDLTPELTFAHDAVNGRVTFWTEENSEFSVLAVPPVQKTITYDAMGGVFEGGADSLTITQLDIETYAFPAAPTRAGYNFVGWFDGVTNGAPQVIAGQTISETGLFAKWTVASGFGLPDGSLTGVVTDEGLAYTNVAPTDVLAASGITDLVIPDMLDGKAVIEIGRNAFRAKSAGGAYTGVVTSVKFGGYVQCVRPYAFYGQPVTSVTFAVAHDYRTGAKTTLYVQDRAFEGSDLKTLTIPAGGICDFSQNAFSGIGAVEDVYLYGSLTTRSLKLAPFRNLGKKLTGGKKVMFHLSPAQAADAAYVAALTNGMDNAAIQLDQKVLGSVAYSDLSVMLGLVMLEFTPDADSPWKTVNENTVYMLYAENPSDVVVGTGNVKKPRSVTRLVGGKYHAIFDCPAGISSLFLRICIGE